MKKSIALIGTLDTKGDQVLYLKGQIEDKGLKTLVIDVGILGDVPFDPEITRQEIASAAGTSIEEIIAFKDEARAINTMTDGARKKVLELCNKGLINGVLIVGGSMGTALALKVLKVLPLGLPKVIISTLAYSHAISPEFLSSDVLMVPWIGGLWGINDVSRRVLSQAAGIIVGAVNSSDSKLADHKMIGVTSLGMASSRYLYHLRPALEKRGYEASVYHATGMSVRFLEKAIEEGSVEAVLELQAAKELLNEACGSVFSPGPRRFEAAAKKRIPQIYSTGVIESCLWAPRIPLPRKFKDRPIKEHNPLLCMICTSKEEKLAAAELMIQKINNSNGPRAVVIPKGEPAAVKKLGFSDLEGMDAFRQELKNGLKSDVKVVELDGTADDLEYTDAIVTLLDEMR